MNGEMLIRSLQKEVDDNGRCIHIFQLGNIFFGTKDVSAQGDLFILISG